MAMIISTQDLCKSFGIRPLFQNISIGIEEGDRVGLIGPNGAGKSTFVKILAALEDYEDGEVAVNKRYRICYLPQEDVFEPNATIHSTLVSVFQNTHMEDYEKDIEAVMMADRMGFADVEQKVSSLSGGWKKRLALAKQLIQKPDLLLMDEPTNHLDVEGIFWLESFLKTAPFAYLVISHDRYFLEHVCTRIIEINRRYPGGHFNSQGSYSDFLEKCDEFYLGQLQQQEALANRVRREVEWLRRGPAARTTKSTARIKEAHQLIGELAEIKYRNNQNRTAGIDFSASDRRTKKLLVGKGLSKSLGGKVLFKDLDLLLSPGTRMGLMGPNGSGKSSLLKIIQEQLKPDSGTIERAENLKVVYFDQTREKLDNNLTLKKALSPDGDQVIYRGRPVHVATWAKRFLFNTEQLGTQLKDLSGGERARILIARLMQEEADLLILDEPTNDLDIPTLEVLEDSLLDFPGALILVTHDRYMMDRVSTQILALDGKGDAEYFADYSQWEAARTTRETSETSSKSPAKAGKTSNQDAQPAKPKKLSYKDQRELDQMETTIQKAEAEVERITLIVQDPALVREREKLQKACDDLKKAQDEVTRLYKRWADLEAMKG